MRRRKAIKVRAALCSNFSIPWDKYPTLTIRERDVLIGILAEEAKEADATRPGRAPGQVRVT